MNQLVKKISSRKATIGVIGMGYIGLSLLEAFGSKGFSLVGYDINEERVNKLKHNENYYNFLPVQKLFSFIKKGQFTPSCNPEILEKADVIIISVPTPLDPYQLPDLSYLRKAFASMRSHLKKGQLIILQSTTYPGTTEEELVQALSSATRRVGKDFYVGYVPEISDPGNRHHTFRQIPRIVSGVTPTCLKLTALLYRSIGCKVTLCPSTRVAEAAKILQNTYRLVNISLINEMKMLFDNMGVDIWEVIEAAKTKPFGFTPFYPGPGIGGDCIGVVPVYLSWKARLTDGPSALIDLACTINRKVPHFVIDKTIEALSSQGKSIRKAKILILGVGYKKDVDDLRESASLRLLPLFKRKKAEVFYHDPLVPSLPRLKMDSISLDYRKLKQFDAIVIATDHSFYDWKKVVKNGSLIIDTRNVTSGIAGAKDKVIKA